MAEGTEVLSPQSSASEFRSTQLANEDVLGLLQLISPSTIEAMRRFALDARTHTHRPEPSSEAPGFGGLHQVASQPFASLILSNDQALDLRDGVVGQAQVRSDVDPAGDGSVRQLRDEQGLIDRLAEMVEARLQLGQCHGIAELRGELGGRGQILSTHVADGHGAPL